MGVLKTIFFIVLFYYAFKLIARILVPFLLSYFVKKAQNNFHNEAHEDLKNEGEVSIKYNPNQQNKGKDSGDDHGEYVDYEELN